MLTRRSCLAMISATAAAYAAPRRYAFEYWDVFTKNALSGNPLAVFLDATGLSDTEMAAIAKETNLSETTFIFPRDPKTQAARGIRVRIFQRDVELPFAGHPTLGTARAIFERRGFRPVHAFPFKIMLELNIGRIPVTLEEPDGYGEMLQQDAIVGADTHDHATIASLIGLQPADLDPKFPLRNISTGRPNILVMLQSLDAMKRLQPDWNAITKYFASGDKQRGFYFLCRETVSKSARVHARKLARLGEDPATGSAAGCAAAYLVETGIAKRGERVIIEQGIEMNRPSEIYVAADGLKNIRVGGYCAKVMEGTLTL